MKRLAPTLAAALTMLLPVSAQAQWEMLQPSLYLGPQISFQAHHNAQQAARRARGDSTNAPATAAPAADPALLDYRPDTARRRANLAQFVKKARATDAANAADLERLFAQGDFIEAIAGELKPYGFRIDNVADAYAVWWINAWLGTRGRTGDVSAPTIRAVKAQAASALAATGEFTRAGDAAKQEMAEALLIQAALIDGAVEQAKADPAQLRAVGAAINKGAGPMGLDLTKMDLTEAGFVPLG